MCERERVGWEGGGGDGGGAYWHGAAVFGQRGPPLCSLYPGARSQGVLGCVSRAINFSSILEMTFGGISMLSLGGVGPSLCRHDPGSCHCLVCAEGICVSAGALKYHRSAPSPSTSSFFLSLLHSPPDGMTQTHFLLTSFYPVFNLHGIKYVKMCC